MSTSTHATAPLPTYLPPTLLALLAFTPTVPISTFFTITTSTSSGVSLAMTVIPLFLRATAMLTGIVWAGWVWCERECVRWEGEAEGLRRLKKGRGKEKMKGEWGEEFEEDGEEEEERETW